MKAIILNSGIGSRLRPFTDKNPKCFVKINGKSLLHRQIEILLQYGITDIIITLGPFEDKIKKFIKGNFSGINVTYVKNPDYKKTNYIYSLWLARKLIDDDIILMHGDMLFDSRLLGKLLKSGHDNSVLVNDILKLPEKDFKAKIMNNTVREIGVNVFGKDVYSLAPIYKFSKDGFKMWMKEIDNLVKKRDTNVYAENAFNNISGKLMLRPMYYQKELCMEIDDMDDLRLARRIWRKVKG
ncbi:phosphocholine cytidylyltransferase family protein [Candidatus Woesearchaeota archaeon]|nr:phosphocholine cytidylyltransferase family protein [Candidatus Woesearchaeota archaeon]